MAKRLTNETVSELAKVVERLKKGSAEVVHVCVNPKGKSSEPFTYRIDTLRVSHGSKDELRIWIGSGGLYASLRIGAESPSRHEDAVMFEVHGKELRITVTTPKPETSVHNYSFQ